MPFTDAHELLIRQALAETTATIPEAGFVIPTPLYCNDVSEFWGTLDQAVNTKDEIETENVAATWIYPVNFTDDFTSGGKDSPLVQFDYEFYLFRQYGLEREGENEPPEVFNRQVLKLHNLFIKAWLGIKAEFQGDRNIDGLDPAIFATAKSTSIVQTERIENASLCEFVPGIVGFAAKLQETVKIKLREC